jgi:serpin B
MAVVLPNKGVAMQAVLKDLSSVGFQNFWKDLSTAYPQEVRVSFPKFKIKGDYDLVPSFKSLGLTDAFDTDANFSKISSQGVLIDQIKHKAVVEVDETGTVAAAVTAVSVALSGMPEEPLSFKVDRPFLFFLVDNETGTILFMGRVSDPRE